MNLFDAFRESGMFARLSLLLGFGPLAVALVYVFRPTERALMLLRPLSLTSIFGAIAGLLAGLITVLMGVAATLPAALPMSRVFMGVSDALVPPFVNFALLAVSWVLVTLGMMRRTPDANLH
jgi:hypothetical protein